MVMESKMVVEMDLWSTLELELTALAEALGT